MGKIVRGTYISGEAGVIRFADYCNKHKPYILFREVLKSDFGIDGEIELTRTNEDNKIEPLGEIIKIQIKTVGSDNSYIKSETTNSFEFYPRKDDIEYWEKYKKNGIEVLLVIYDQRKDALYCKKVIDTDLYIGKENLKAGKKKNTTAITFNKIDNILEVGKSNFLEKFTNSFKNRISFDVKEYLLTNFLKYQQHPKAMYIYESNYKNKKAVYEVVEQGEAPFFVIYNSLIYTCNELGKEYASFKSKVIKDIPYKYKSYLEIIEDKNLRNHYVELLNEYLKSFLGSKKLRFQKDYKRYYFFKPKDQEEVTVQATTRKRGMQSEKIAVKKFDYNKLSFYRHIAVECKHFFVGNDVFLSIQPKYLFTKDGKEPVEPKVITKLTNYLTSREYNNHYCDWLHFWWCYLTRNDDELLVYEDPSYKTITAVQPKSFYTKHVRISLSKYVEFQVEFGIPTDKKEKKKAVAVSIEPQQNLLF